MNDLPAAAVAVMTAYNETYQSDRHAVAAALRAAADQVVPPSLEAEFYNRNPSLTLQKTVEIRSELLAIAAELEGHQ